MVVPYRVIVKSSEHHTMFWLSRARPGRGILRAWALVLTGRLTTPFHLRASIIIARKTATNAVVQNVDKAIMPVALGT